MNDTCTCHRCPCCGKLVAAPAPAVPVLPAMPYVPYYPMAPFISPPIYPTWPVYSPSVPQWGSGIYCGLATG